MTRPRPFSQEWIDYFIPSTVHWDATGFPDISGAVMRNLVRVSADRPYGITDPEVLDVYEGLATYKRMSELRREPIPGNYDLTHLRRIHHHLFQDVYPWAGELRTAPRDWPMVKHGPDVQAYRRGVRNPPEIAHRYFAAKEIRGYGTAVLERMAAKNHLRGLDRETFVDELTKVWARINYVHPFREGNTRAQFAFFTQLSADAGYSFQTARFQPAEANLPHENSLVGDLREQFVWGRFEYMQTGDTTLLRETIDAAVVVASAPPDRTESTPAPSYDLSAVRTATAGHPRPIGRMLSGSTESRGESVEALGPERAPAHDAGYEL
ncbi:Fic/DOC family protein [Rhodococcus koreensis]|uniref:protein adenylyltransferase n=1 Tax=Rhodococcus koreensis TaxID=99653 RepID=A0A1H4I602_9NOCA|nr:Fic family protein [Rhodococcus koreensis]SEB29340.1 cell filamentation protein [Rhodococcus koreensis]